MNEALLKKLRYKEGRAVVLNAPEGYSLGIEAEGTVDGGCDFVQLFVNSAQELSEGLEGAISMLKEDAIFWITYPKQSSKVKSDLNRDILNAYVQNHSPFRAVSNVAIDDKWSALRFRHRDKVKTNK